MRIDGRIHFLSDTRQPGLSHAAVKLSVLPMILYYLKRFYCNENTVH